MIRFWRQWIGTPGRGLRRPVSDYIVLSRALCAVPLAWIALRVMPFRRLIRDDGPGGSSSHPPHANVQASDPSPPRTSASQRSLTEPPALRDVDRRICWAVEAVAHRLFPRRPCLVQALAGKWLLQRRGLRPELQIGVRRVGSSIRAHAWLAYNDEIIVGGGTSARAYQAFQGLESTSDPGGVPPAGTTSHASPSTRYPSTARGPGNRERACPSTGVSSTPSEIPERP